MIELSNDYLEYIHEQALKLLKEKGMEVESYICKALPHIDSIKMKGTRLFFEPKFIDSFVKENYQKILSLHPQPQGTCGTIRIGVCDMPQYYQNPRTGKTELMMVKSLIESTQFLESMQQSTDGVWSMVPGVPRDVPKQLQAITEYYIGCVYCSNGGNVDTMYPEEAVPYIFRMAEAMGDRIDSAGMFTISPLKLGGFEMKMALEHLEEFQSFSISSLPSPAATAPIFLTGAWIVSIAEVLAGAAVLYILSGGKPVYISAGLFPFEPRKLWMAGGMPEHAIMEYQRGVIAKRYNPVLSYSHSLTTAAKVPGAQTMLEKSTGAVFAALNGCRDFNTAGLLSFDDIFSPAQFILDVELRDRLYIFLKGQYMPESYRDCGVDWSAIIEEGLENGYLAADTTLDYYKQAVYFSDLLDRSVFQKDAVLKSPAPCDMVEKAVQKAREIVTRPQYKLDDEKMKHVTQIFQEAWKNLSSGAANPFQEIGNFGK